MDIEKNRDLLAQAVRFLDSSLAKLVDSISHAAVWIDLAERGDCASAVRRACEAIAAIDYGMDDAVNQSVVCLGVIGTSPAILERVRAVNDAKAHFKKLWPGSSWRHSRLTEDETRDFQTQHDAGV